MNPIFSTPAVGLKMPAAGVENIEFNGPIDKLIHYLTTKMLIEKWFFIRYEDPDFHLRLRFKINNNKNLLLVMNLFTSYLDDFLKTQKIWKIQIDTYLREIERYGGNNGIELAEEIFFQDSNMTLALLKKTVDDKKLILFGTKLIDNYLALFNLDKEEALSFAQYYKVKFHDEFNLKKKDNKQLNAKYRILENSLNNLLSNNSSEEFVDLNKILDLRNKKISSPINIIIKIKDVNNLNILGSFIHMSINRIFDDNQRFYELICYDYLTKFYVKKKWDH
jgi:thiopeptide-type bacteriocin biosynthesis protein